MRIPSNDAAERAVLAGCLLDGVRYNELLGRGWGLDHFHAIRHQALWIGMNAAQRERGTVDEVTVHERLAAQRISDTPLRRLVSPRDIENSLESLAPLSFLLEITRGVENLANFTTWVHLVEEAQLARSFCRHLMEQYESVCDQPGVAREKIEETATWLIGQNAREEATLVHADVLAHRTYDRIERQRLGQMPRGLEWGLVDLDRICNLAPGAMNVLAARPAMGKSALAANVAYRAAVRRVPSLFFGLEMTNHETMTRLFAMSGGVNMRDYAYNRSTVTPDRLQDIAGHCSQLDIHFEDAARGIHRICSTARRLKLRHNIGLIVLDYLQLAEGDSNKQREQEISSISRACKNLAKELDVSFLVLSQLNREVERRDPPRPRLADLRESGALEQDADVVVFISPTTKDEGGNYQAGGKMLIDVAKNRHGSTGVVPVTFTKQFSRFENYAEGPNQ